jgi:hypothetical protein
MLDPEQGVPLPLYHHENEAGEAQQKNAQRQLI